MVWQSGYLLREGGIKMKTVKYMDEETVIKKAMQVLIKELGPVEAIRFITIPKSKRIACPTGRVQSIPTFCIYSLYFFILTCNPHLIFLTIYPISDTVFPRLADW
jgi:hypothetical protein